MSLIRVLAISPRFAPTNGADTHRLRLLLNHAVEKGWPVEVLAVDPADVASPVDPWLEDRLPTDVLVHRVRAWQLSGWGLNGLAQRSMWPLYKKGCELLATGHYDIVFFSTTEFALHLLGPLWKHKYCVPFCMDYQDPWVNDYYRLHPDVIPPGGRIKFGIMNFLHRIMERLVVRHCSGFIAVSEAYLDELERRYSTSVMVKPRLVRPFPAEPAEFKRLATKAVRPTNIVTGEHSKDMVWRYIGRGGADMAKAASAFFLAWRKSIAEDKISLDSLIFEAYGTSYAASGKGEKTFEPLIVGTELVTKVKEITDRLPYSNMLLALLQSDALVVFGSDDPAYTASKIYPYLLAQKPLLTIFHKRSSVVKLLQEVGGAVCVTFDEQTSLEELASSIQKAWFEIQQFKQAIPLDHTLFDPYTANVQAQDVGTWFAQMMVNAR